MPAPAGHGCSVHSNVSEQGKIRNDNERRPARGGAGEQHIELRLASLGDRLSLLAACRIQLCCIRRGALPAGEFQPPGASGCPFTRAGRSGGAATMPALSAAVEDADEITNVGSLLLRG